MPIVANYSKKSLSLKEWNMWLHNPCVQSALNLGIPQICAETLGHAQCVRVITIRCSIRIAVLQWFLAQ